MNAAQVDASGNIYLAGQTTTSGGAGAAYIAKLNPNGTAVYAVAIGGSGTGISAATALDIDSAGAIYVAGTTTVSAFPVSAGTAQLPITGLVSTNPPVALNLPFVVTPDCSGTFCYSAPAFVSAGSLAGSISGVTQVQLRAPAEPGPGSAFLVIFSLSPGATAVRDMNLSFWVE